MYQQQRELVKAKILEMSVAVFREKGYDEATIDEITRRVGIAKGTFYNFYISKSEILLIWAAEKIRSLDYREALDPGKTTEENLYSFTKLLVKAVQEEQLLFKSFLKEILKVQGDPYYHRQFDLLPIYGEILAHSSDYGIIAVSMPEVKIEVINNALFMGMINALGTADSVDGLEKHLNRIVKVCVYGLLGEKE